MRFITNKINSLFVFLFLWFLIFSNGCSFLLLSGNDDFDIVFTPTAKILIVVENSLFPILQNKITQYTADLEAEGISTLLLQWDSGTVIDLRTALNEYYISQNINGAFLIGNLPSAWYEMGVDPVIEEFPCDLFFMDPTATWHDSDNDSMYDSHSPLALKLYVSRIKGDDDELIKYFTKLHDYRSGVLRLPVGGYVFKDDDWYDYKRNSSFGLSQIYNDIKICENPVATIKSNFIDSMVGDGHEFINQWIHSQPGTLYIIQDNQYQRITSLDIWNYNFKGLFYNLYNCSAARFTQNNLAMTYLTKTDYALAVLGSTKVGGCYHPVDFYEVLSRDGTWGDAYLNWYNYYGKTSDVWFLGMVILGDPTLRVSAPTARYRFIDWSNSSEPNPQAITDLEKVSLDFVSDQNLRGFQEFKLLNPDFY